MTDEQLDLFSAQAAPAREPLPAQTVSALVPASLSDEALLAAIPNASIAEFGLIEEAGRRRLTTAVACLEELCHRLTGFGRDSPVPEQVAALRALAAIGGGAAVKAIGRILARGAVQGPTLIVATEAAARLKIGLPPHLAAMLLRHAEPEVRANACRCARAHAETIAVLIDLLDDLNQKVRVAAACALGRTGRLEARPLLKRLLREAPSREAIGAAAAVADEECCVMLGRIARDLPELAAEAIDALNSLDDQFAQRIIAGLTAPGMKEGLGQSEPRV
jgi:hypothetical protein